MPKVICTTETKVIRDFPLDCGKSATIDVEFYFEAGDQGCLCGPYDKAVEPTPDYYELLQVSQDGNQLVLSYDEEERLISQLQRG